MWNVTVWGVRGSFPVPKADFLEFGGNTSCVSVDCGDTLVILDAGSGLIPLGKRLVREKRRRVDILLSHFHLDHIMGLFSFPLLYMPAAEMHLYGTPGMVRELPHLIGPPLWPVGLSDGRAKVLFHEFLSDEAFSVGNLTVTTLRGNHPGGCVYYRLEGAGRSLVYALDCELAGDMAGRLTRFAQGTDLLIWDAAFSPGEEKPGWGHSTWRQGLELGRAAEAKRVLMTHYNSNYNDTFLREQESQARQTDSRAQFAKEGMVIAL